MIHGDWLGIGRNAPEPPVAHMAPPQRATGMEQKALPCLSSLQGGKKQLREATAVQLSPAVVEYSKIFYLPLWEFIVEQFLLKRSTLITRKTC